MAACEIRTGFFTLEPCRQPSVALCTRCLRATCGAHLVPDGSGLCVECAAEQREGQATGRRQIEGDDDGTLYDLADSFSFYRYRSGYYASRSYHPSYGGDWDRQDRQAFAAGPATPGEGDWDDADGNDPSALDS
jgi:hypothetical protein